MKKLIVIIASALIAASLTFVAGCGGTQEAGDEKEAQETTSTEETQENADAEEESESTASAEKSDENTIDVSETVIDDDVMTMVVKSKSYDPSLFSYGIDIEVVNNTDSEIAFDVKNLSLDDQMYSTLFYYEIAPGKTLAKQIDLYEVESLDEIKNVEMSIEVTELDNFEVIGEYTVNID